MTATSEAAGAGCLFLAALHGLRGTVRVPGDKSVSHRAVLLGAVSSGPVVVRGFLHSADTLASIEAVRALGVRVDVAEDEVRVHGAGWEGLREPGDVIDVRNAGTLMRLLPGLVASRDFLCVLTGDASIRRRPMGRILGPLAAMGATVAGRRNDTLPPIAIRGGALRGSTHELTVASAQVKSCLLLAGLRAEGETVVVEPGASRDHTERMIAYAGGRVERRETGDGSTVVRVWPVSSLDMNVVTVPGDFSSAAFFLVGATLLEDSRVTITDVGLNPTRTGLLEVLRRMGADLEVALDGTPSAEPIGRVTARSAELTATDVGAAEIPRLIDEVPLFLLAAAKARGVSRLRGAAELRAKESDRLAAMAALLRSLGVDVVEYPDGLDVTGEPRGWKGSAVRSMGDHRLAMTGAIAGVAAREGVNVDDVECIGVSYPGFIETLTGLGGPSTFEALPAVKVKERT